MSQQPESAVKDKHYDLIAVLHHSQKLVWKLETYIADARREGDEELAQWFAGIQEHCRTAGAEGKRLLAQRLQEE